MAAQIFLDVCTVKNNLAATNLHLDTETNHTLPEWGEWTMVSTKRRVILAMHHLEWAWSILHGYPELSCYELGPRPAPAPRQVWEASDEATWKRRYKDRLYQWQDGCFKMEELFTTGSSDTLNLRTESWLAESDEFGLMLMAEGLLPTQLLLLTCWRHQQNLLSVGVVTPPTAISNRNLQPQSPTTRCPRYSRAAKRFAAAICSYLLL